MRQTIGRLAKGASVVVGTLVLLLVGTLAYLGIPQNAAGMAAKGICSAAWVAGRPLAHLMDEEVLPASPVLAAISISVNEVQHTVTARFAGIVSRRAALVRNRGCVLDVEPDPLAQAYQPSVEAGMPLSLIHI